VLNSALQIFLGVLASGALALLLKLLQYLRSALEVQHRALELQRHALASQESVAAGQQEVVHLQRASLEVQQRSSNDLITQVRELAPGPIARRSSSRNPPLGSGDPVELADGFRRMWEEVAHPAAVEVRGSARNRWVPDIPGQSSDTVVQIHIDTEQIDAVGAALALISDALALCVALEASPEAESESLTGALAVYRSELVLSRATQTGSIDLIVLAVKGAGALLLSDPFQFIMAVQWLGERSRGLWRRHEDQQPQQTSSAETAFARAMDSTERIVGQALQSGSPLTTMVEVEDPATGLRVKAEYWLRTPLEDGQSGLRGAGLSPTPDPEPVQRP